MSYYICRRAFRDAKGPVPVGSVVDPTGIKRFRYRLQERHIVEVTEQNFEQMANLFKMRHGIIIPDLEEPKVEEPKVEEPKVEEPKVKEPKAKPVAKAKATSKK